jgi:hypothetical protein
MAWSLFGDAPVYIGPDQAPIARCEARGLFGWIFPDPPRYEGTGQPPACPTRGVLGSGIFPDQPRYELPPPGDQPDGGEDPTGSDPPIVVPRVVIHVEGVK